MTTKPAKLVEPISFDYQEILNRLLNVNMSAKVSVEISSMSNPDNIIALVNIWHNRLRNFRSTDSFDATALLANGRGRQIMSNSIRLYLSDWAKSDWVDAPEIIMLATDIARLWPRDAEYPDLKITPVSENTQKVSELFIQTFADHQNDAGMRFDDDFDEFEKTA